MRGSSMVLCATLLAGCTGNLARFHPTMEADAAETGAEGFIYMNEMGKAYRRTTAAESPTCETTRESYQDHERYTIARYKVHPRNGVKESARTDFRCLVFRDDPTPAQVRSYVAAGFALSDLYCRTFFRRIVLHSSTRNFDRTAINDIGTAASAIFGLANAGSAATGAVGAAAGLADSAFRDYDSNFLVSADLPTVQEAVLAGQTRFATAYLSHDLPRTYVEASPAIQAHAYFCTFNGMCFLVTKAVSKETASKPDEAPTPRPAAAIAEDELNQIKAMTAADARYLASDRNGTDKADRDASVAAAIKALQADEKAVAR